MNDMSVAAMRDRIEELEEENRQLRQMMRPNLQFKPELALCQQEARLLALLYERPLANYEQIAAAFEIVHLGPADGVDERKHVGVVAHRLRRKLKPHGIKFNTIWGVGYAADSENKARIRAGIISTGDVEN